MPTIYYTTARLAKELGKDRASVCKLIQLGKIQAPDIRLKGVGPMVPEAGYSLETIARIKARLRHK